MSIDNLSKINSLLQSIPAGTVAQSFWLTKGGYSPALQQRYRDSQWLDPLGKGAMVRKGDQIGYAGGIYALQKQSKMSIHPGANTALSLLGKSHYLNMWKRKETIFGATEEKLPSWFLKHDWGVKIEYYLTSFLPPELGLVDHEFPNFSIKISGAIRAIMECLYLAPEKMELMECFEQMEGLNNLKPMDVQALLEACQSIKVKRLFLFMAEKAGHDWFRFLKPDKIELGQGKRSLVKAGVYIDKYQITVPRELKEYGERSI